MLYVIDQRLKAQRIAADKSVQVIHDVTSVLLEPKFIDSLLSGSTHRNAQVLTTEHCKFMLNDIATCSLMRLDDSSMDKLWSLMTMIYKWQLFVSRHQLHLLEITFRHLDSINKLYPDTKRHMLIDFTKNTLLDFWNACGEEMQLTIYNTNKAWLQCFNTKISLLIRLGFQAMDGSFIANVDQDYFNGYAMSIGDNIYIKSANQMNQQQTSETESNSMNQLAAQLNINQSFSEDLQPIFAGQFQQQLEQTFNNILFDDFDFDVGPDSSKKQDNASSSNTSKGCEFVQVQNNESGDLVKGNSNGSILNQNLLDLYSQMP
ncbi:uncharacterized protein Dwil_GK19493 [Drosophila willistoni]|uniref:Protein OSCP1 n=1 Tax=Drosophila willistoni TaxID=7260 RepID=B4MNW5_DROWI|nr:protein OSCP1 [Drosophila willistoni]EDW73804.1 uncharacterized protein Dwil_GK19493 [Drosophila willistoni]